MFTGKNWLTRSFLGSYQAWKQYGSHAKSRHLGHLLGATHWQTEFNKAGHCQDLWHTMAFLLRIALSLQRRICRICRSKKSHVSLLKISHKVNDKITPCLGHSGDMFAGEPCEKPLQARRNYHPASNPPVRCASLWSRSSSTIPECPNKINL